MTQQPPRLAFRLLEWYCRFDVLEEVRGDLEETWELELEQRGRLRAGVAFWWEVLLFVRSHTIRKRSERNSGGSLIMWKNWLLTALRSARKHKVYAGINYFGLALGLACSLLILQFVRHERSFDTYHQDADRIYRLVDAISDTDYDGIAKVHGPWGVEIARTDPAVEIFARFVFFGQAVFEMDGRKDFAIAPSDPSSFGYYADSTTFDLFSWQILAGDSETALVAPNSLVITESFARNWFGDEYPIGRTIRVDDSTEYTVTAVIKDVPGNSHFRFAFLVSMGSYGHPNHDSWEGWNQYYTYLKLRPDADPERVAGAIEALMPLHMSAEQAERFTGLRLQPLGDIYLRSNMFREIAPMGNEGTVTIFAILAAFILVIAGVNYVNLATARAGMRAREVGVRKSLGAGRTALMRQFMVESILTALIAGGIAQLLMAAALPSFNSLAGTAISRMDLLRLDSLIPSLIMVTGIGFMAGLYPAFVLSSYSTVRVIKGVSAAQGSVGLRRGLVVLQFTISAALIMGSGIVADQLEYIDQKPLGVDAESVVSIPRQSADLTPRQEEIKARMATVPGVEAVSLSGNGPGGGDWGIPIEIPGVAREDIPSVRILVGDADYPTVYGMQIVQGRSFDPTREADRVNGLLINQELARQLDWVDPIGRTILMPAINREFEVIGVIGDFHFRSMREAISPLILFQAPQDWYTIFSVRFNPEAEQSTLQGLAAVHADFDPFNPFRYTATQSIYDGLYAQDDRLSGLLRISTLLSILLASMGLFGLTSFIAERRTKEIGIRKVVGASSSGIVALLSKETVLLVGIALLPAVAAAVLFGRNWLGEFAYDAGISPVTLGIGGAMVALFAVGATMLQAMKAARLNPVDALKSE